MSAGPVRAATPADVPTIARFIRELARYEQLEHQLDLDEARAVRLLAAAGLVPSLKHREAI